MTQTSISRRRTRTPSYLIAAFRLLQRWRTRRAVRRTIRALHGLPEFMLNDIGLRRDLINQRFGR